MAISTSQFIVLIQLVIAHVLADFFLQLEEWVKDKEEKGARSKYLYLHVLTHFLTTFLLLGELRFWPVVVFLSISHWFIDVWKIKKDKALKRRFPDTTFPHYSRLKLKYFVIDQFAHLFVIGLIWLYLIQRLGEIPALWQEVINSPKTLIIIAVYGLGTFPVAIVIGIATREWQMQISTDKLDGNDLANAGIWIGILERLIILTLVLVEQYESIGFLIAAKSLIRFSESNQKNATVNKKSEYILIGTLLSYGSAILLGVGANALFKIFVTT